MNEDKLFCRHCGSRLKMVDKSTYICDNCRVIFLMVKTFCPFCGSRLKIVDKSTYICDNCGAKVWDK